MTNSFEQLGAARQLFKKSQLTWRFENRGRFSNIEPDKPENGTPSGQMKRTSRQHNITYPIQKMALQ